MDKQGSRMESKVTVKGEVEQVKDINVKKEKNLDRELLHSWVDMWKYARKNKLAFDVLFKVGPNKVKIACHKVVLMINSEVFEAKFSRWEAERPKVKESNIPVITLLDDDPETFKLLLEFVYSCPMTLNEGEGCDSEYAAEQLLNLVALARKYLMMSTVHHVTKILVSRKKLVTTNNVIQLYDQAKMLMEEELKTFFENEIIARSYVIFKTDASLQFTHENLLHFLKKDDLNSNEIQIFKGCIRWAELECETRKLDKKGENLKEVLGEAMNWIRFPVLSPEKLLLDVKEKGVLSDKELLDIMSYKKIYANKKLNPTDMDKAALTFPYKTAPRDRAITLKRCERKEGESGTLDFETETCIAFNVDRDIKIVGLGFFGGTNDCTFNIDVKVKMSQTREDPVIAFKIEKIDYKARGSLVTKNVFPVYFLKPVDIKANVRYIIAFSIQGAKTYFSREVTYTKVQQTHLGKVNFYFHSIKANQSVQHFGQMPFIYFRFPASKKDDKDTED